MFVPQCNYSSETFITQQKASTTREQIQWNVKLCTLFAAKEEKKIQLTQMGVFVGLFNNEMINILSALCHVSTNSENSPTTEAYKYA